MNSECQDLEKNGGLKMSKNDIACNIKWKHFDYSLAGLAILLTAMVSFVLTSTEIKAEKVTRI